MKQKIAELTEVIDEEVSFFQVKNEVMQEYYPLIGASGFALYSFYKCMSNRSAGNTAFPSFELARKHLGMATSTTNRYNWLLEHCGLIRIIRGNARANNVYRLLKVNPVSPELLARLTEALKPEPTDGKEWAKFKAATLEAVANWLPLRYHFKKRVVVPPGQIEMFSNGHNGNGNGHHPEPASEWPSQAELVAWLVKRFSDSQPPLSESVATKMIEKYGVEAVTMQCEWLENRETDNPLRTLRAALKGNWSEPKEVGKAKEGKWFTEEEFEQVLLH